jgi:hypothetical protein
VYLLSNNLGNILFMLNSSVTGTVNPSILGPSVTNLVFHTITYDNLSDLYIYSKKLANYFLSRNCALLLPHKF